MTKDLGSIEVGKIADLIILDKNPLDDIHNTREIRYVMKGGSCGKDCKVCKKWREGEMKNLLITMALCAIGVSSDRHLNLREQRFYIWPYGDSLHPYLLIRS